jgi:L-lactate dehydrogenase complex protein LldG
MAGAEEQDVSEDAVLQRIAERLRRAAPGADAHETPLAEVARALAPAAGDAVEQFRTGWAALSGHVHDATPSTLAEVVAEICRACGAGTVLSWDDPWLAPFPLVAQLRARGLAFDFGQLPPGQEARRERLAVLADIGVGLTGTYGAIAESASVVVASGPGRSRLASLLPPVHVAIVRRRSVFPTLPDFLRHEPQIAEQGSNLVLISGPSRTADIEMTLTRGVHGPGEVHAVLLDDA